MITEYESFWFVSIDCPCGCGGHAGSTGFKKDENTLEAVRRWLDENAADEAAYYCRKGKP